ncbi:(2Fe-2S) ferredoxin domain-containing protein [Eubacterium aggregans]|uniref:(2Fe-2S) ferredoxin domain-containing protein n=1 Tax=Eubacterium aggregans TaxID=81409 RepID=UPI003F3CCE49
MKDQTILICCGTGCRANGSMAVAEAFGQIIAEKICPPRSRPISKRPDAAACVRAAPWSRFFPRESCIIR